MAKKKKKKKKKKTQKSAQASDAPTRPVPPAVMTYTYTHRETGEVTVINTDRGLGHADETMIARGHKLSEWRYNVTGPDLEAHMCRCGQRVVARDRLGAPMTACQECIDKWIAIVPLEGGAQAAIVKWAPRKDEIFPWLQSREAFNEIIGKAQNKEDEDDG